MRAELSGCGRGDANLRRIVAAIGRRIQVGYYDVRFLLKYHGATFGLRFDGASHSDTVSIAVPGRRASRRANRRADRSASSPRVTIREAIHRLLDESPSPRSAEEIRRLLQSGPKMVEAMLGLLASEGRIARVRGKFTTLEHALAPIDLATVGTEVDRLLGWTDKIVHVDAVREWLNPALGLDLDRAVWLGIVRRLAESKGWFVRDRLVATRTFEWASLSDVVAAHVGAGVTTRETRARVLDVVLLSRRTRATTLGGIIMRARAQPRRLILRDR